MSRRVIDWSKNESEKNLVRFACLTNIDSTAEPIRAAVRIGRMGLDEMIAAANQIVLGQTESSWRVQELDAKNVGQWSAKECVFGAQVFTSHVRATDLYGRHAQNVRQLGTGWQSLGSPRIESGLHIGISAQSAIANILAVAAHADDIREINIVTNRLLELCDGDRETWLEFAEWISANGFEWVVKRRPAFAAVLEAAARLGMEMQIATLIAEVLERRDIPQFVALVAAQRCRLVPVAPSALRERIATSLLWRIAEWESSNPKVLEIVLPSVPYFVSTDASLDYLVPRVENSNPSVAWGALIALLDWTSGTVPGAETLTDEALERIFEVVRSQYKKRSSAKGDLRITTALVWILGSLGTEKNLGEVTRIIASAFSDARGDEDAAALRAGRLLVRRWKDRGINTLVGAFADAADRAQYLAALVV